MRIMISSDGKTIEDDISHRFGRCRYFLLVDTEGNEIKKTEAVENQGAIQNHGAGTRAAQQVAELHADAVISGDIGPNAMIVLENLGIGCYTATGPIKEAAHRLIKGDFESFKNAESGPMKVQDSDTGRVFIPLLDDNGMDSVISEHFGHAPYFGLYDYNEKSLKIIDNNLDHSDSDKSPVDQVIEKANPTMVVVKSIGKRAIDLFCERGISIKTGEFKTLKDVIKNLDKLEDQTSGCSH